MFDRTKRTEHVGVHSRVALLTRPVVLTSVGAGFLILALALAINQNIGGPSTNAAPDEIHWTLTGPTSVTFDWRGTDTTISFGTTAGTYTRTVTATTPNPNPNSSAGPFREAKLTGLNQDTTYFYKIGTGSEHTFRTPPPAGSSDFWFAELADIGDSSTYATVAPLQSLLAQDNASIAGDDRARLVVVPGDLTYGDDHGLDAVDQHFNDVMPWSQDSAYMAIWGNHEWGGPDGLDEYEGRFDFPNSKTSPGAPSAGPGEDWYWFDYGNIRFIAYPEPYSGAFADWNTKVDPIMAEAQNNPAITFIVTFGHRPAYSTGSHSGDSTLAGYLNGLHVKYNKFGLNINGHSHNYERTCPILGAGTCTTPDKGLIHVTGGGGGSSLGGVSSAASWTAVRSNHLHFIKFHATANKLEAFVVCGPAGAGNTDSCTAGSVIDTWSITAAGTPPSCTPNWSCGAWGACSNGSQSRMCTDTNSCGTTVGKPAETQSCQSSCTELWTCGAWSACSNGNQTRSCTDAHACGTTVTRPPLSQSCTVCTPNWQCSAWSICTNSSQSRSCTDANSCGVTTGRPPESQSCSGGSTPNLITDPSLIFSVPGVGRPGYLSPITDPVFHTKVTRIADNIGQSMSLVSGSWGSDARHHYSKDQPWNSDQSLILLQNSNSPSQILLDGETYQPKFGKCSGYSPSDDRWHPSTLHPHERINAGGTKLEWFDVVNCQQTRNWTLPFSVSGFGPSEGNASNDGRFAVLTDGSQMFVVDMDPQAPLAAYPNKRIGPVVSIASCGLSSCAIDWVSVAASGKYAVVSYNGDHPRVYDINPTTLAMTPRAMPANSPECSGHNPAQGYIFDVGHADFALNPFDNNEDVLIGQKRSWCPTTVNGQTMGEVIMVRLKDNTVTSLTGGSNEAQAHHISTRNINQPGWVYVGYYPAAGQRFNDEIVALKMDGSQSVKRLAHKHSVTSGCYRCETHAVPSLDGQRVMWASNWSANCGSGCASTSDIKAYVVDYRDAPVGMNQSPNGTIDTPTANMTINIGQSVYFTGTGSDPDNNLPLSYSWTFGGAASSRTVEDPGAIQFNSAGVFLVTLTVTDSLGLPDSSPATRTVTVVAAPTDTTPPGLSNGQPSGTLPATTTQTTLTLTTNESATCRYSTSANTAYTSMTSNFTATNGTAHTASVAGLTAGTTFRYYVRCQDSVGNTNTADFPILFQVQALGTSGPLFQDDFEDGNADGWTTVGTGTWSVVNATTKMYQQATTTGDAWSTAGSVIWTDYSAQATFKPMTFGTSGFGGLYARWKDTTNWYYLKMSATRLEIKKNVNGVITELVGKNYTFTPNTAYTVQLEVNGSTLRALVNNVLELHVIDTSIANGKIAVGTFATAAQFDNVQVDGIGSSGDSSSPTTPLNVIATPVSATSIGLAWTASTDNVGVTGYWVFRRTSPTGTLTNIGTSTALTFADTGLTPSTIYYYVVQAFDAAGNSSNNSNQTQAATAPPPDTTAPSGITDLAVTLV